MSKRGHTEGRPTTYDPAKAAVIIAALAKGVSWSGACRLAGVPDTTARNWRELGEKDPDRQLELGFTAKVRRELETLREFSRAVAHALGELEEQVAGALVRKAKGGDVPAIKYLLSTRFPDDWREQSGLDLTADTDGEGGVHIKLHIPGVGDSEEGTDG